MRLPAAALLLLGACVPATAVEISNFRSGLACTNTSTREDAAAGWICHVTEDVLVTDQGQCRYDGKDQLCTWIGFEFDYRGAQPGDQLECSIEQSKPTAFGNPKEELAQGATSQKFVLPLEEAEGHFYNPQYFTFTVQPHAEALLVNTGRCAFQGEVVFQYTYRLRFPTLPKHGAGA